MLNAKAEAKAAVFKQILAQAATTEVVQATKTVKALRRSTRALILTGVLNIFIFPQGVFAIASAVIINSISDSDLKPDRSLKISIGRMRSLGSGGGGVRVGGTAVNAATSLQNAALGGGWSRRVCACHGDRTTQQSATTANLWSI